MEIEKIQDDGSKFLVYGQPGLPEQLQDVFSDVGLGISVTTSSHATANILYTENNRDIVLRVLKDYVE